jgi:hypothetical protein
VTDGGAIEDVYVVLCDIEIGVQQAGASVAGALHTVMIHEHDTGDWP